MKKLNFTCFVHISCLVLVFTVAGSGAKECGDAKCKAPIAKGYATLSYMGGGGQKVNMKKGEKLLILGRDFGKDKDFLVQTVNGITGLASTKFVRETEILISRKNRILIPEEESQEEINPSATTEPSVVDGTTISSVPLTNPSVAPHSPDSRYQYSVMSNYETETDFSPPPSPPPHSRRSNYDRERDHRSDRDRDRDHDLRDRDRDVRERDGRTSGNAGGVDRGSGAGGYPKAFSPPSMRTTSPPIQDPRNKKYQGGGFSSGSQDSMSTRKSGKQYKNSKPTA